ncbi:MAG: hypothetical protein ACRC42_01950, partial [Mycoplasma sp.]
KYLIKTIEQTSGNTRTYAINSWQVLFEYESAMQYLIQNKEIINELYKILVESDNINTIGSTLGILAFTVAHFKEELAEQVRKAAEDYEKVSHIKIYSQLINFVNNSALNTKQNAMLLICLLLTFTNNKEDQAQLLLQFKEAGIIKVLIKNAECKSEIFQKQWTLFQQMSGEIIKGSKNEIEIYKDKMRQIELNCKKLEKKVEFILLNQKFYERIVDDYVFYKKMADCCGGCGGFYEPSKFYC